MSVDVKMAARSLSQLSVLKFFPADDTARTEIVGIACRMAVNNGQIEWLARRCVALWNEWEGPREMRAVFCSKYKPLDGIDIVSSLPQFADGIPSEDDLQITGAEEVKRLPPGPAVKLLRDAAHKRTLTAAPRERDRLDKIDEEFERNRAVRKSPQLDEAEIERIRQEQESRRDPEAAAKLARKLGIDDMSGEANRKEGTE